MKYAGMIGFWEEDVEVRPGIWKPRIVERPYTGDLKRKFQKWDSTDKQTDDLSTSNQVEIVADLYMMANFTSVRYLTYQGKKLSVKNATIDYPRVILEIGGVYNGPATAS